MGQRMQKGLNKNRNHHDSLSYSGGGRIKSDSYITGGNHYYNPKPIGGFDRPYGQGKHSNGGRPKQNHNDWRKP
ncbi:MAG: hypothetical protein HDT26_13430 [Subdoligranulum sp.]|nr:hypothetical protein [Subdoligranulum sp.]